MSAQARPRIAPFLGEHRRYEQWFERHAAAYASELLAVRALLPWHGRGLEIGVGSGRFASPLGVQFGIDPAREMLGYARARGVRVACAVAEALPFAAESFDYALVVTTICFVEDPAGMLREARRVLRADGTLVIGMIDRASSLGREYLAHQAENVFYRAATFHSAAEVASLLAAGGFRDQVWTQTVSRPPAEMRDIEPLTSGTGRGAFAVVRARAPAGRRAP